MTLEQLFAEALKNAQTVKAIATPEQIANLDYEKFKAFTSDLCLLGQLTGNAYSDEAKAILPKTIVTRATFKSIEVMFGLHHEADYRIDFDKITFIEPSEEFPASSTPLEAFLMLKTNSNELFEYLKGERETFEPRML